MYRCNLWMQILSIDVMTLISIKTNIDFSIDIYIFGSIRPPLRVVVNIVFSAVLCDFNNVGSQNRLFVSGASSLWAWTRSPLLHPRESERTNNEKSRPSVWQVPPRQSQGRQERSRTAGLAVKAGGLRSKRQQSRRTESETVSRASSPLIEINILCHRHRSLSSAHTTSGCFTATLCVVFHTVFCSVFRIWGRLWSGWRRPCGRCRG